MAFKSEFFKKLKNELAAEATLVVVSKIRSIAEIQEAYQSGVRDFGENYVQELLFKHKELPADIRWHFIGHLQSNKVKHVLPVIHLIHGVDSLRLLNEIEKQAAKTNQEVRCLLQVHIAKEETKFGFDETELDAVPSNFKQVRLCGLMGMATNSTDTSVIRGEFRQLKLIYDRLKTRHPAFETLSMGMSGDYITALEEGSNMLRIGSLLFGSRP